MLVMLVIAMIVYALIPVDGFWIKFAVRLAMLPVIIGVTKEFLASRKSS